MKPLVLVHGFMGGGVQWQSQRRAWGDAREIITPDLPGFGANNAAVAPDTIAGFAEYVLAELDSQGVEQFDLLGHSMGGMIVQEMVALAPERVQRLVLYGTAAAGDLPGRFESFATSRQRAEEEGVDAFADRVSATWRLSASSEISRVRGAGATFERSGFASGVDGVGDLVAPRQFREN